MESERWLVWVVGFIRATPKRVALFFAIALILAGCQAPLKPLTPGSTSIQSRPRPVPMAVSSPPMPGQTVRTVDRATAVKSASLAVVAPSAGTIIRYRIGNHTTNVYELWMSTNASPQGFPSGYVKISTQTGLAGGIGCFTNLDAGMPRKWFVIIGPGD